MDAGQGNYYCALHTRVADYPSAKLDAAQTVRISSELSREHAGAATSYLPACFARLVLLIAVLAGTRGVGG